MPLFTDDDPIAASKILNLEGPWPDIGNLTELPTVPDTIKTILCNYNKLTTLGTLPPHLLSLRCQYNQLKNLPPLPNTLEELLCTHNSLTTLPPLPPNLIILGCSLNEITTIKSFPSKLYTLNCQYNKLTQLPPLPNTLHNLSCQGNEITILENLPPKIFFLQCDENNIETITNFPRNARIINISDNYLDELPELPRHLKDFDCHNNDIRTLPELPNTLIDLNCSFNKLTSIPDLPSRLETLHCSDNNLTSLPKLPISLDSFACENNNIREYPNLPPSLNFIFLDCDKVDVHRLSPHNLAVLLDFIDKHERADFSEENNWGPHNFTQDFITALREQQEAMLFEQSAISVNLSTIPASTVILRGDETVNDVIEGERSLISYVNDDPADNIVFLYANTFYPLKRSILASALQRNYQNNMLVYFCDNNEGRIHRLDTALFVRLRPFGLFLDFMGVDYIRYVVKDNQTYYKVFDTGVDAISAVSYNIYHYAARVGIVSAAHCQEGQGGRVYALKPLNVEIEVPGTPNRGQEESRPFYEGPLVIPDTPTEQLIKRKRTLGGTRRRHRSGTQTRARTRRPGVGR